MPVGLVHERAATLISVQGDPAPRMKLKMTKEQSAMGMGQGFTDEGLSPNGESLRNAVRWLSARLAEGHPVSLKLVEEAALRFDLSPLEEEFLLREWLEGGARSNQQEGEGALPK